jgi:hypothetical protein
MDPTESAQWNVSEETYGRDGAAVVRGVRVDDGQVDGDGGAPNDQGAGSKSE